MPTVSIVKVQDEGVEDAVRQAVALAGGLPGIGPGSTVLLKPNVVNPSPSGSGQITDARVTEAVARMVMEHHPGRIIIGEGASVGYDMVGLKDSLHCMEVSGTAQVARKLGTELLDLNRDERIEVRAEDAFVMERFAVARAAWEADVIIDLPVIKTHGRTGITCGMKNMKGVLPGREKKRTHRLGLDRAIVDLNRVMKPHFTVVDAIVGMQGIHAYPEDRASVGRIVAGADVVAVDTVCAAMMGFDVEQILHVKLAGEAGLGIADLDQIELRGEALETASQKFVSYQEAIRKRFGMATVIEKKTCTGCMGEMISTFLYLDKAGFADRLSDLKLVLGLVDELPEIRGTPVIVGQCPRAFRDRGVYVPGCPPHGTAITDGVCEALGIDREVVRETIRELHDF